MESNQTFLGYEYDGQGFHKEAVRLQVSHYRIEELAAFLVKNQSDKVVTDLSDSFVLDTFGMFVNKCHDQEFLRELLKILVPLQQVIFEDDFAETEEEGGKSK